jgi:predicted dithiol-disulfide oxidoreductase (DUF899 family)
MPTQSSIRTDFEIEMTTGDATLPSIVSHDEWLTERKKLLAKEKKITHSRECS